MPRTTATALPASLGQTLDEDHVKALVFGSYADTGSRVFMVIVIAAIFGWLNYEVMSFIREAFKADLELVKATPTATRVVTTAVLQSLVAATVIQVGVAIVAVVSYLFPKSSKPSG